MRPRSVLAAAGMAVALSACAAFDPNAATVNGTEINRRDFEDELNALRDNQAYANAVATPVAGDLVDSTSTSFAAQTLTNTILFQLVDDEIQARGLTVDPAVHDAASQLVAPALLGPNAANADAVVQGLPSDIRDRLERWTGQAVTLAMDVNDLSASELPQYYEDNREQFEEICLGAVPATTPEDANAALEALAGGADIATVIAQYVPAGSGIGPNGELDGVTPCFTRQALAGGLGEDVASQLEGVGAGDLVGPIDINDYSVVFVIDEPQAAGFEADQPQLLAMLLSSPAYAQWQQQAATAADVSVDPRYGTWDGTVGAVVPPAAGGSSPVGSAA